MQHIFVASTIIMATTMIMATTWLATTDPFDYDTTHNEVFCPDETQWYSFWTETPYCFAAIDGDSEQALCAQILSGLWRSRSKLYEGYGETSLMTGTICKRSVDVMGDYKAIFSRSWSDGKQTMVELNTAGRSADADLEKRNIVIFMCHFIDFVFVLVNVISINWWRRTRIWALFQPRLVGLPPFDQNSRISIRDYTGTGRWWTGRHSCSKVNQWMYGRLSGKWMQKCAWCFTEREMARCKNWNLGVWASVLFGYYGEIGIGLSFGVDNVKTRRHRYVVYQEGHSHLCLALGCEYRQKVTFLTWSHIA